MFSLQNSPSTHKDMDFDKLGLNAYAACVVSIKRFQIQFLSSFIDISHYWKDQNLLDLFNMRVPSYAWNWAYFALHLCVLQHTENKSQYACMKNLNWDLVSWAYWDSEPKMVDISKLRFNKHDFKLFVKQSLCIPLRDICVLFWNSNKYVKKKDGIEN